MVVGAFPAAKLGVLLLKQISKPIANLIKIKAKDSQFFRQYVCMPPAQIYNWCEVQAKMWSMNLGKPVNVPQLNEAMAIELGANLLGEVIIFTIGAGLLIYEYVRSMKKDAMKEQNLITEKLELELLLNELSFQVERQETQMREMQHIMADLESKSWLPRKPKLIQDAINTVESHFSVKNNYGNFNPKEGVLFKALYYVEKELFDRQDEYMDDQYIVNTNSSVGISGAIDYLNAIEFEKSRQ